MMREAAREAAREEARRILEWRGREVRREGRTDVNLNVDVVWVARWAARTIWKILSRRV